MLEQNPKIEIIAPPTKAPNQKPEDNGEIDDLNFHLSKRKHKDAKTIHSSSTIATPQTTATTKTTTTTTIEPRKI